MSDPGIIVSLDYAGEREALAMARSLDPSLCRLKVGKELFTRCGPGIVEHLTQSGFEVFLDLKFHDIPNTVARACEAAVELGVWMLNVHASGGSDMLQAAREAVAGAARPPLLIAVTVLTSLSAEDLRATGVTGSPEQQALRLARLARAAGLDGVVCSAREAAQMRRTFGRGFKLVTPGIRPAGSARDDQRRIMTPAEAVRAGSDYLVVGRPVTRAADPVAVLSAMVAEIGNQPGPTQSDN